MAGMAGRALTVIVLASTAAFAAFLAGWYSSLEWESATTGTAQVQPAVGVDERVRVSIERELAATRTAMEKGADLAANAAAIAATAADRASAANDPFAGIAAQRANQAADEAAEFSEMAAQWLRENQDHESLIYLLAQSIPMFVPESTISTLRSKSRDATPLVVEVAPRLREHFTYVARETASASVDRGEEAVLAADLVANVGDLRQRMQQLRQRTRALPLGRLAPGAEQPDGR